MDDRVKEFIPSRTVRGGNPLKRTFFSATFKTRIMKLTLPIFLLSGALLVRVEAAEVPKDPKEKMSYGFGVNVGNAWKAQELDLMEMNLETVMKGIKDSMSGSTALSAQEIRDMMNSFRTELTTKREAKRKVLAEKNKLASDAFLAENKTKPGIQTLPSGLQYKVLSEGNGAFAKLDDMVTVNYRGTFTDGTEFDSSFSRGQPATFGLTGVIKGWQEALQRMKPGSKWQIFVPPDLGYGEQGMGGKIQPNVALIFEIELLTAKSPEPPPLPNQPVTSDIIKVPSAEELKKGAQIEIIKPDQIKKQP
jgi:FKBP-type peptidyl-prolyl cis-trans isomerase